MTIYPLEHLLSTYVQAMNTKKDTHVDKHYIIRDSKHLLHRIEIIFRKSGQIEIVCGDEYKWRGNVLDCGRSRGGASGKGGSVCSLSLKHIIYIYRLKQFQESRISFVHELTWFPSVK